MNAGYGKVLVERGAVSSPYAKTESRDTTEDAARKVYVGNLPYRVRWQDLKDHMRQAGTVEYCKILTEDGTDWGSSRGAGIVVYSTKAEATNAIASLNEMRMGERNILVDEWTGSSASRKQNFSGKGSGRILPGCVQGYGGVPKGFLKGFGRSVEVHGDSSLMCYVGNLAYSVRWQELKDHMKQAGSVEFCKILTEDGTEWSRSRGVGCVRYSSVGEVQRAIATLGETELQGRPILVDRWTSST